ncbi:NUDIX hydrolase [Caballeronia hypogeia]|uniref:NUDIX hydrolase n=1 Tax=Caballeronia hypogeia TaxID=1777140 RepID=A0A158DEL6_9BURK|nr:NUDIX hydrolase [Caballeronia hypogeia]SAK92237.1 NUDIX hydrolase [Caballeronia hypogeia]
MPNLTVRPTPVIDAVWRLAFRLGFPLARAWWRLRRPHLEGALVAIYVGQSLLLLKTSYRSEWSFPGGSLNPGETPDAAAQREMKEEIGLPPHPLNAAGSICGMWDGRQDRVYIFELHIDRLPELKLDNREIIDAQLASPETLDSIALTGPVVAYLDRKHGG